MPPEGFINCMRLIHEALADHNCITDELMGADNRAAARMTFREQHRGTFANFQPTGRDTSWTGGSFRATDGQQIIEPCALGDVDGVKQQLNVII